MAVSSPRKSSRDSRVAPEAFYGDLDQLLKKGSPKPAFRQIIEWVRQIAEAHNTLQRDHFKLGHVQVHRNGSDQGGIIDATWTEVNYTDAAIDRDDWFDLGTNEYVPKRRGWYFIVAHAVINNTNTGANDQLRQRLLLNGSTVIQLTNGRLHSTAGHSFWPLAAPVQLDGDTDAVTHEVRIDGADGNVSLVGKADQTFFSAWRWL